VNAGKVLVDGRVRRTPSFPVGLFDVVTIPSENLSLRLVPSPRGLIPSKIAKEEAEKKLCAVSSKVIVRGGRLRYGFHDGRSMAGDGLDLKPGDAVLMQLPEQKVLSEVRLAKESLALVLSGERAGELGRVLEVKQGASTGQKPSQRRARKSIREFGVHKGEPIGVVVTLRGERTEALISRLLVARENKIPQSSFDQRGSVSFGIKEHIEIPGTKYDPALGILGIQGSGLRVRPGTR